MKLENIGDMVEYVLEISSGDTVGMSFRRIEDGIDRLKRSLLSKLNENDIEKVEFNVIGGWKESLTEKRFQLYYVVKKVR
jgi:hypothetical protein